MSEVETYSGRKFTGDLGEYTEQGDAPMRDIGHIREMVTALDEGTEVLLKTFDNLVNAIEPVLRPTNPTERDDQNVPRPVRCPIADQLARANDKVQEATRRIQLIANRVDI